MSAYRLGIFDLGGVVVDVESDRLVHQVAQIVGCSFEQVQEVVYHPELLLPFELGWMTPEAYFDGLRQRLKLPWSYERFVAAWNDVFREKTDVTAIAQQLHQRYQLIALSNTNVLHLAYIRRQVSSLSVLADWVASCDVGLRKPDPAFYQLALKRIGVRPQEVFYIDDRPEMVEAGQRLGLTAMRFETSQQLQQELRHYGILHDE